MATFVRSAIPEFALANPYYPSLTVTVYLADENGQKTSTLATLYESPVGPNTLLNPQTLDSTGKFVRPVYVEQNVVVTVSGPSIDSHDTGLVQVPMVNSYEVYTFDGDGSTDEFSLPNVSVESANSLLVVIDGVVQEVDEDYEFDFATKTLTLITAPASGTRIVVTDRGLLRDLNQPSGGSVNLESLSAEVEDFFLRVSDVGNVVSRIFESVADMKDFGGLVVGQFVRTLGYYEPGDGGGNDYEIVAAGTGADDGGSFIDLSGSGLQARGLFSSAPVNVKQFGAVGDGTTDDQPAIQSCIDFVVFGAIRVPKGNYAVGDTIDFKNSDTLLIGEAPGGTRSSSSNFPSRLTWIGISNGVMFTLDSGNTGSLRNAGWQNLTLDGAGTEVELIYADKPRCWLRNVSLRRMRNGITAVFGSWGWSLNRVSFFNFSNIGADLQESQHNWTLTECQAEGTGTDLTAVNVVRIGLTGHSSNVNFYGCDFEARNVVRQIDIREARNVVIVGGYMEAPDSSMTAFIKLGHAATGQSVDGCTISSYFQGGGLVDFVIQIQNTCSSVVVEGNDFRGINNAIIDNQSGCKLSRVGANALNGHRVFRESGARAGGFDHSTPAQVTIPDDGVIALTPPAIFSAGVAVGKIEIWARRQPAVGGGVLYDAQGAVAGVVNLYTTSNFASTTGELTGTTGTDGNLTVSAHTDGKVYIENRLGQANDIIYSFCEPWGA